MSMIRRLLITTFVLTLAAGGLLGAAALANPRTSQYVTTGVSTGPHAPSHGVAPLVTHGTNPGHAVASGGSLPFTGISLAVVVGVGLIFVVLGLALRQRGRRGDTG
jgi:hypothetical protein